LGMVATVETDESGDYCSVLPSWWPSRQPAIPSRICSPSAHF